MKEILYIVVPCYNEEEVLPVTSAALLMQLHTLIEKGKIAAESRVLFVDDGSKDKTWQTVEALAGKNAQIKGIRLSRNRGQQNALMAGLMEAMEMCDVAITIDADGQDDVTVMEDMIDAFHDGCDIVYGVRSDRKSDSHFKRNSAQAYYKLLDRMGVETVYNHSEYRLASVKVLRELARYKETNLFLRGIFPLIGFKSTSVYYSRTERVAGETKYPLKKMLQLAFDGITSLSIAPLHLITKAGVFVSALSFVGIIWAIIVFLMGKTVAGWASLVCIICFTCGLQMVCLGILGEYLGRIYLETKERPRYVIAERTEEIEGSAADD